MGDRRHCSDSEQRLRSAMSILRTLLLAMVACACVVDAASMTGASSKHGAVVKSPKLRMQSDGADAEKAEDQVPSEYGKIMRTCMNTCGGLCRQVCHKFKQTKVCNGCIRGCNKKCDVKMSVQMEKDAKSVEKLFSRPVPHARPPNVQNA